MYLSKIFCTLLLMMPVTCKAPVWAAPHSVAVDITTPEGRNALAAVPAAENIQYNEYIYRPTDGAPNRRYCYYSSYEPIRMNGKLYQGTGEHNEYIAWQRLRTGASQVTHTALYETLTEPGTVYDTVHHAVKIRSIWTDGPNCGQLPKIDPDQVSSWKSISHSLTTASKWCIAGTIAGIALICKYKIKA